MQKLTGYAAPEVLEKTRAALLKVQAGEAAFERDSMAFDVMEYPFSLLAGLLRATATGQGRLSVLDLAARLVALTSNAEAFCQLSMFSVGA